MNDTENRLTRIERRITHVGQLVVGAIGAVVMYFAISAVDRWKLGEPWETVVVIATMIGVIVAIRVIFRDFDD